jgi:hypothetical protein
MAEIRIIDPVRAVGAEVEHRQPLLLDHRAELVLEGIAGMVGGEGDSLRGVGHNSPVGWGTGDLRIFCVGG